MYNPYPRRLESLTICWCNYKGSTFSSVILRPWVLVRSESNSRLPASQPDAQQLSHQCAETTSPARYQLKIIHLWLQQRRVQFSDFFWLSVWPVLISYLIFILTWTKTGLGGTCTSGHKLQHSLKHIFSPTFLSQCTFFWCPFPSQFCREWPLTCDEYLQNCFSGGRNVLQKSYIVSPNLSRCLF